MPCYVKVNGSQNAVLSGVYDKHQYYLILPIKNADSWVPVRPIDSDPLDMVTLESACCMAVLTPLKYDSHCSRKQERHETKAGHNLSTLSEVLRHSRTATADFLEQKSSKLRLK